MADQQPLPRPPGPAPLACVVMITTPSPATPGSHEESEAGLPPSTRHLEVEFIEIIPERPEAVVGRHSWLWMFVLLANTIMTALQLYLLSLGKHFDEGRPEEVRQTAGSTLGNLCLGYWALAVPYFIIHQRELRPRFFSRSQGTLVAAGTLLSFGYTGYTLMTRTDSQSSILIPATSLYIVVPIVLGVFLRGESWTWTKAIGIFIAGLALILLSADFTAGVRFDLFEGAKAGYFFLCVLCWGVQVFLMGSHCNSNHTTTMACTAMGLALGTLVCVFGVFRDYTVANTTSSFYINLGAGGAMGATHWLYYKLANYVQHLGVGVLNTLCSTYIVWGVIFGLVPPLSEPITANKFVGILLACVSVVILSSPTFVCRCLHVLRRVLPCARTLRPETTTPSLNKDHFVDGDPEAQVMFPATDLDQVADQRLATAPPALSSAVAPAC